MKEEGECALRCRLSLPAAAGGEERRGWGLWWRYICSRYRVLVASLSIWLTLTLQILVVELAKHIKVR